MMDYFKKQFDMEEDYEIITEENIHASMDDLDNDIIVYTIKNDKTSIESIKNMYLRDVINKNVLSMCIFEFKEYIDDIWASYSHNVNNVWNQFYTDFNRQDIFINDNKCNSIDEFHKFVEPLKVNNYMGFICHTMASMLCNQSSFGLPFQLISSIYSSDDEHRAVTSRMSYNQTKRTSIYLYINSLSLMLILKTILYIVDTDDANPLNIINVEMNIDIPRVGTSYDARIGFLHWDVVSLSSDSSPKST